MKAVRRWAAEQRLQPQLEVAHNLDDAIKYHADLDRRLDRTITTVPIPGSSPGTEPVRKAAQAHRRQPGGRPVRVRDQSRCSLHQQRLRTEPPTQCDRPQGHKRIPLRLGAETYAAFRSVVSTAKTRCSSNRYPHRGEQIPPG